MSATPTKSRAELFRYRELVVGDRTLLARYELDGRSFVESIAFDGVETLSAPGVVSLAHLWYLLAGLSYYKAGAARVVDLGSTPLGANGRALMVSALREGLGEFAYRNDLHLDDVVLTGGGDVAAQTISVDASRVLVPFGGGIDSVVTTTELATNLDSSLFVVSPSSGRFSPLEATAAVTGLPVVRATRTLDPQILRPDNTFFRGHVPVTAMVTLLAAIAAAASGRGGVVMSNEHSASVGNLHWRGIEINHQWSKSLDAERLLGAAVAERVGPQMCVASFLRDRSEVWVAQRFSALDDYHDVFRSCNRAFAQSNSQRLDNWCGECDKCLFINLMLAPFLPRERLRAIFGHEPLSDPRRLAQLGVLVGAHSTEHHKPFECVGDPGESAAALARVSELDEWADVEFVQQLSREIQPPLSFHDLLAPLGPSRVPAHWLR